MRTASRPRLLALTSASLVFCVTGSALAAPATETPAPVAAPTTQAPPETPVEAPADAPAPAEVAAPEAPPPAEAPAAEGPAEEAVPAPPAEAAVPEPPAAAEPAEPAPTAETAPPSEPSNVEQDPAPENSGDISPDLLATEPEEPTPAPTPKATRTVTKDNGAYERALNAAYEERYRPADNPGRLHLAARGLFANAGGDGDIGGRMGGLQADVGQAWNRFGYALTASAWGGSILLSDRVAEMNGMFGIGPTLTLGRSALQQRGMIDLRIGYDFMYAVVNQRSSTATIVAPQDDGNFTIEQSENLLPHGPRVMLQLGLLSPRSRNYNHGVGIVMGYQGLVGSLRGELPFTHMLMTGLQWWMG
ncbi:MAG: hypothetical protein AAGA54_25435 [Myxococcota bacterium]